MKRTLIALLTFLPVSFASAQTLTDIADSGYRESIGLLLERGIVAGYEDSTFRPRQSINRAEFLKIIVEAFFPEEYAAESWADTCFADIDSEGVWYAGYACFAKDIGLISGYPDGTLRPANPINAVEAAKIISLLHDPSIQAGDGDQWYEPYMRYMLGEKFIPTNEITNFDQELTRAQMAEIIGRGLRKEDGRLPEYLVYRKSNYDEVDPLGWYDFDRRARGLDDGATAEPHTPPEDVQPDALVPVTIPRDMREYIEGPPPGGIAVDGNYLSSYDEWVHTDYAPNQLGALSYTEEAALRREVADLVNEARRELGVPELSLDFDLNVASQNFAEHLVVNAMYSHRDKYGMNPYERAKKYGYTPWVSESLSWSKDSAQAAVDWWKSSDLHWNNITNARYHDIGVGIAKEPGGRYLFLLMTGEGA